MNGKHALQVTPGAVDASPFERAESAFDRRVRIGIYILGAAILIVGAYLGWVWYRTSASATAQTPTKRAVANLSEVVRKDPRNAAARIRLAEALSADSQLDAAVAQLKAALQLDKQNVTALTDLGLIAMHRKQWTTAEDYWTKLIGQLKAEQMSTQDQRLADVYYYLGTTQVEEQRYEEAVANLKASIAVKRDASPVHYMLSVAYARLDLADMQQQELEIVLAFDPKHAQAAYDMGVLLLGRGDTASAAEYFRVSADNAPDGVTKPQAELAKLGPAANHLRKARESAGSDPGAALVEARISAALDPTSTPAVKLVAELWEKQGNHEKALNAWRRYLELVPGDKTATDAIERLSADAN